MSCRWGRRGEGAVFVWGRHGGGQRAPGRWAGSWRALGGALLRGVAALAHEGPCALPGGEVRASRVDAMSHAFAEARRAAISLPRSE